MIRDEDKTKLELIVLNKDMFSQIYVQRSC